MLSPPCRKAIRRNMTATSDRIIELLETGWFDSVDRHERQEIVRLLRADRDMPGTVRDLHAAGKLYPMLSEYVMDRNFGETGRRDQLAELLGGGAGPFAGVVGSWKGWLPRDLFRLRVSRDLHDSYRRMGARLAARSSAHPIF